MSPILTISRAVTIDGHMVLLSAPFDRQGRIVQGVGLNPMAPAWYEPFRRVVRLFAGLTSTVELPAAVRQDEAADRIGAQMAEHLAQMEHTYRRAAIDAYRAMDAAQGPDGEGDGHAIL